MRVKIYGAGSVGNHHAHAARQLGWQVTVCDKSNDALARMKNEIYPGRYGAWDGDIELVLNEDAPQTSFDLVIVGSPPDSHLPLVMDIMDENPGAILVEKPLCPPSLELAQPVYQHLKKSSTKSFVGYDHVVSQVVQIAESFLAAGEIGEVLGIDVEFREHWEGIFKAHPWLNGPADTYLGYWQRGGGASGEHSHALNLWQHLAHEVGADRIVAVNANLVYVHEGEALYDRQCFMNVETESGLVGRVVQDVVTRPPTKRVRLQGTRGRLDLVIGHSSRGDAVLIQHPDRPVDVQEIPKTRPDDFIRELKHIDEQLNHGGASSPIRFERGLDTMLVIAAAHRSHAEKSRMRIDFAKGYCTDALIPESQGAK